MNTTPSQARSGKEKRVWLARAQAVGRSIKEAMSNNMTPSTIKAELPRKLKAERFFILADKCGNFENFTVADVWPCERIDREEFAAELVCRYNQYEQMLAALYEGHCWSFCECRHPHCKRCHATKQIDDAIRAATGKGAQGD